MKTGSHQYPSLLFFAWLLAAGCGGAQATKDIPDSGKDAFDAVAVDADTTEPDIPIVTRCEGGDVRILKVNPWPGGGLQVYMSGLDSGQPVTFSGDGGAVFQNVVEIAPQTQGLTGILLEPAAAADEMAARVASVEDLLEDLPGGERVAAWVVRPAASPGLVSDLAPDYEHLMDSLGLLQPTQASVTRVDIDYVRGLLDEAEGRWGSVLKRVVVFSGAIPSVENDDPVPSVAVDFVNDFKVQSGPDSDSETVSRADVVAASIRAARQSVVRLGVCPDAADDQRFLLITGDSSCEISAPKPMKHLADDACLAQAAANDEFDFGDTVELVMTPEQEAVWQQMHADKSKDDFSLSVRLGHGDPIPASAHFRGQTSMDCERKNYDVNLAGGQSRRLMPGGGGDEFFLISMCKDEGYFNQVFANRLLAAWDVFPLKSRIVRLRLNGQNHGLYLMMQEPSDTLVKNHAMLQGVVRRPFEPDPREEYEVKHSGSWSVARVLQEYMDMVDVATTSEPAQVKSLLAARLDIVSYLRWMAAMTFLHNGDYVDEVFFYGSVGPAGTIWWRPMNWDADDLFSDCHHGGLKALPDEWGMLYCAEGFVDQAIVGSFDVYSEWISQHEFVMGQLDEDAARSLMDEVKADLFALLDDETAAAMVELHVDVPGAVNAEGAKAAIQALMDDMLVAIEANRIALLAGIEAYRQGTVE